MTVDNLSFTKKFMNGDNSYITEQIVTAMVKALVNSGDINSSIIIFMINELSTFSYSYVHHYVSESVDTMHYIM